MKNSPVYWTKETKEFFDLLEQRVIHKAEMKKLESPEALERWAVELWVYPGDKDEGVIPAS